MEVLSYKPMLGKEKNHVIIFHLYLFEFEFEYVHISLIRALLLKEINVVKNGHGMAFISNGWKARRRRAIAATCFYISDKKRYMALKLSFKKNPGISVNTLVTTLNYIKIE